MVTIKAVRLEVLMLLLRNGGAMMRKGRREPASARQIFAY
jgi:hypothetical protein